MLILRAGSAFDRAYEAITACLLEYENDPDIVTDDIIAEAETLAAAIRGVCRAHGYFLG